MPRVKENCLNVARKKENGSLSFFQPSFPTHPSTLLPWRRINKQQVSPFPVITQRDGYFEFFLTPPLRHSNRPFVAFLERIPLAVLDGEGRGEVS